ncbi:MBL fold metallo-hydrolase [Alicyclobacillus sp. SO9]|uniref:MBL fold metallo-hydrolase n=1 Tax=Alicyclobacillus sp. SO9 TaxID=2665646 RepID=UPI0018E89955|nr:MBL fold metallo-hydrolase [Alicyclobacillus sp. SO9]QQE79479.1 MBL fold metallo-hydrolase [Alicyclobacillus sp. SO9]
MDLQHITDTVFVVAGPVNLGLVKTPGGLVAIDSGLDKQSAKNLLKAANELQDNLIAVINTHAHADHFGGNETLQKRADPRFYAPVGEADVIRRPAWEPQYLWQGAAPLPDMRGKFLLAAPSRVDEVFESGASFTIAERTFQSVALSGHSHYQSGILVDGVLFCADAYLDENITDKHGLPFFVNYLETLQSAKQTKTVNAQWWVPAHGIVTDKPGRAVDYYIHRLQRVFDLITTYIAAERRTLEQVVSLVCQELNLTPRGAGPYALVRTPVSACITAAVEQGLVKPVVEDGYLWFERGN